MEFMQRMYLWWSFMQKMYLWWSLCRGCTSGGVYVEDIPLVEYVEDVPLVEFMQRMYL